MLTLLSQQKMNLGSLKYGQPHSFFYEVKNNTDKNIVIHKLITGCNSCTKVIMNKAILNPGDKARIDVIFTPGSTGINIKSVDVSYDDTILPLKFTANVYA